ncbi:hypothetical protein [Pseudomonas umsongensis]|uniref:hypothetical protein n=1 Tax=Pseudomonas umsongensis TaxID=198618 RepID=UPI0015BA01EE|nr:hypothetical protein [Pseudomonas umsongensis]NWL23408.1 hypothetical protein [Pseudomonas umsongensis]
MVSSNRTLRVVDPTFPKPEIIGMLDDKPGGEPGLLPVALTGADLKVWFTIPRYSDPTKGQEKYELFVDNDTAAIATRYWDTPITDSERYLELPATWMRSNDGQHRLYYQTTIYNGSEDLSFDLAITLDGTEPVLASDNKAIFPDAVLPPNKLTDDYLQNHQDALKVDIPAYLNPRPWDRITWYWQDRPGNPVVGGVIELDDTHYGDPVVLTIPGSFIRAKGDDWRYVRYEVRDRAGNLSRPSEFVEVEVDATPIPRSLPWPSIEKAIGNTEVQTINPLNVISGAVVVIPDTADLYPNEDVWVHWGEEGSVGEYPPTQPLPPGSRRYAIPMPSIAAYIGKTIPVSYYVTDGTGGEFPSVSRKLKVQTVPSSSYPLLECEGLSGGNLSVKNVDPAGAKLQLGTWVLMTEDQWIRITMTGINNATGQESVHEVIPKRQLREEEVTQGIGVRGDVKVPKDFLIPLRRNERLTGKIYLSFDGGQTWPPLAAPTLKMLEMTLVD